MMYVDGKGTVFPVRLKVPKKSFEKDVTDLIETNH